MGGDIVFSTFWYVGRDVFPPRFCKGLLYIKRAQCSGSCFAGARNHSLQMLVSKTASSWLL